MQETLGPYRIIRRLAQGGMAEVLLAKQSGMGGFERLVCIKRILPHLSAQEDFLKMFQDEARIAANLVHPNIAQIYDIAQENDDYYIAMEYVRGEDLRRVYNQEVRHGRTLSQTMAAYICLGVAGGLDYAHRQLDLEGRAVGLVHRDISPQNILVTYDGFVKIIDFGVAKAANKLIETRSGVLKGKYSYMSPEQASGDPVDGRTDIFALGVTLYEITTGTRLFKRENELETLHAVIACNVTPPSKLVAGYSPELEAIVLRALAYDVDDRFTTAGEMQQALRQYLRGLELPPDSGQLASYMQELFADKLADEALVGGSPWEGTHTPKQDPQTAELIDQVLAEGADLMAGSATLSRTAAPPTPLPTSPVANLNDDWETEIEAGDDEQTASQIYLTGEHLATVVDLPAIVAAAAAAATAAAADPPPSELQPLAAPTPTPSQPRPRQRPASRRRSLGLLTLAALGGGWWWLHRSPVSAPTLADPAASLPAHAAAPISWPDAGQAPGQLSIASPEPLVATVDRVYRLGETPLQRVPLAPGSHHLGLESQEEGLKFEQQIEIVSGQILNLNLPNARGTLSIAGRPWAWAQVGQRIPFETPATLSLLSGNYSVLSECPDGRRQLHTVTVRANGEAKLEVLCPEAREAPR